MFFFIFFLFRLSPNAYSSQIFPSAQPGPERPPGSPGPPGTAVPGHRRSRRPGGADGFGARGRAISDCLLESG